MSETPDGRRARRSAGAGDEAPPEVKPPTPPTAQTAQEKPQEQPALAALTRVPRRDGMFVNGELVQQTKPSDSAAPQAPSAAGDQAENTGASD